jgi:Secretion system C-terminal sorting domain
MKNIILVLVTLFSATALQAQPVFVGGDSDTLWYYDTGENVNQVKFSPDDEFLAVAQLYSKAYLMNVSDGKIAKVFDEQAGDDPERLSTRSIDFLNKNGKSYLVVGSWTQTLPTAHLEVFSIETGEKVKSLLDDIDVSQNYGYITKILITPDQKKLIGCFSVTDVLGGLIIWDTDTWEVQYTATHLSVKDGVFRGSSNEIVLNCLSNNFYLFNIETHEYKKINYSGTFDDNYDISPDGNTLYIASDREKTNILYDLVENIEVNRFKINGYPSRNIKFSNYENLLVCDTRRPDNDAIMVIYDLLNNRIIHEYERAPQSALDISKNQNFIASSTSRIFLYNAHWQGTDIVEDNPEDNIIYPNPAGNQAFIKINSGSQELAQINLFGAIGTSNLELEYQLNIGINEIPLDISHLTTGTYLINITTNSFSKTYKFIKE